MSERPSQPWREVARWMNAGTPVNKGSGSAPARKLPEIGNPLLVGALGVGALGVGVAMRAMRPTKRGGRSERFRSLVLVALDEAGASGGIGIAAAPGIDARVDVREGFGKPTLASLDILLPAGVCAPAPELAEILDRATRAVWDNRELAPLAVRGRVLSAPLAPGAKESVHEDGADTATNERIDVTGPIERLVLADMTAIGFEDEIARPADLYARYGAPASDPKWRP